MGEEKRDWKAEADDALRKTGDSLSAAWESSRGARMSALEAAKEAMGQLGAAIDRGVAAAKENWADQEVSETPADDTADATEAIAEEE